MSSDGFERLSREIHRIIGARLSDEQLQDLLRLKPLSTRNLNRFFQVKTKVQLKKGHSGQIVQALDEARGGPAAAAPPAPSRPYVVDPDLGALATREGRALAKALREILREVHFD